MFFPKFHPFPVRFGYILWFSSVLYQFPSVLVTFYGFHLFCISFLPF